MKLDGCGLCARLVPFTVLLAVGVGALVLAPGLAGREGAALAQDKKEKEADRKKGEKKAEKKAPGRKVRERDSGAREKDDSALRVLGILGSRLKDSDYYELNYSETDDQKRTTRKKVWLKIPAEGVSFLRDRTGRIQEFKEGDKIQLLGRVEEREVPGSGAVPGGIERIIKLVRLLAGGEGAAKLINEDYADPKDETIVWSAADVEKAGAAIKVKFEGGTYNVVLDRAAQVVFRDKVEEGAKLLRPRTLIIVRCPEKTDRPEGAKGKDAELEAFEAAEVIFVDQRLAAQYGAALSL